MAAISSSSSTAYFSPQPQLPSTTASPSSSSGGKMATTRRSSSFVTVDAAPSSASGSGAVARTKSLTEDAPRAPALLLHDPEVPPRAEGARGGAGSGARARGGVTPQLEDLRTWGRSRGSEGKVEVLGSSCSMHCQTLQLMEAVCLLIHHITYSICYDGPNWKLVEVEESAYRMGLGHAWEAVSASLHRSNK